MPPATAPTTAPTGPAAIPAANPAAAPPTAAPTPASIGWAPAASVIGSGLRAPVGGRSTVFSLSFLELAMTSPHTAGCPIPGDMREGEPQSVRRRLREVEGE